MKDTVAALLLKQYRGRTAETLPEVDKEVVAVLIEGMAKRLDVLEAMSLQVLALERPDAVDHPKHYTSHPSGIEAAATASGSVVTASPRTRPTQRSQWWTR